MEMLQSGWSPNCYTHTVLIEHLAGSGKYKEVLEIFNKMQEVGVQPDKAACNILVEKCCKTRETWAMTHILQYMKENRLVLCYPFTWKLTLKVASESDVRLRQVNPDFSFEHANKDEIDDCNAINTDIESVIDGRLILDFLRSKNFVAVDYLLSCMMDKNTRLDSGIISTAMKVNSAQCY
ncbi:unnamed protein product [Camellia sinensis]